MTSEIVRVFAFLIVLCLLPASDTNAQTDAESIRKAMIEIEKAFVARDVTNFEKNFIDGYIGIREKPVYNSLEQFIAMMKWDNAAVASGKKLSFETLSYDSDEPQIYVYGDVAVASLLKRNLWRYKDNRCLTQYQATELWLKLAGEWKIAASHQTTIQCDPLPWQPPHPALSSVRSVTRPRKFLSPNVETDLREIVSKLTLSGFRGDSGADVFTKNFFYTDDKGRVGGDRSAIVAAMQTPTARAEKYRDDDTFLDLGNAALYLFRIRSVAKDAQSTPDPPVVFSVFFVKDAGVWKIAAAQSSSFTD